MGTPKLSCVVAMFQGWRVSVLAFQCGGRTYSAAPNGNVVAGDFARSRWELRVCSRSSEDAVGNDADRIEFRFRDANNRIDVKAARASVPATWLTVSHISGPNLVTTIQAVRRGGARVEGPEQTEQFGQLAAIHQNWWANSVAGLPTEVGAKVVFIGALDAGNFHIQSSSRFYPQIAEIVPTFLRSLWPLCTMIDRWRLQLLKDLQLLLHKPGSRRPKIAEEIVIKLEKMRRGSKTEQVVSSTPGL